MEKDGKEKGKPLDPQGRREEGLRLRRRKGISGAASADSLAQYSQ